uniref:Uncharacterized protein n=1 Tax=Cohnella candidum TaxID=2674991 RepID=A0A3G3JT22_9BACL|nr:hypothetical protein EAV92_01480 [Cohnella candidum]
MPRADFDEEVALAIRTPGQMLAYGNAGGHAERRGFIGRVGPNPVFPTTFVFGNGTAART